MPAVVSLDPGLVSVEKRPFAAFAAEAKSQVERSKAQACWEREKVQVVSFFRLSRYGTEGGFLSINKAHRRLNPDWWVLLARVLFGSKICLPTLVHQGGWRGGGRVPPRPI